MSAPSRPDRDPAADPEALRSAVRDRYAAAARQASAAGASCCGPDPTILGGKDPITRDLYQLDEVADLPAEAVQASLGCGNPTALAGLQAGEIVLDLGSGGGIDVFLAARRVGPTGLVYGLDMTDEMLALAEANRRAVGVENARFLKGLIEDVPLPDESVDVVMSNCVINLSADKPRAIREAFRVLRPGGRLVVSDMVVLGALPESVRRSLEAWAGCVAGALEADTYRRLLAEAGFVEVEVAVTRRFRVDDLMEGCRSPSDLVEAATDSADGSLASAVIRATKPRPPG
jgi:SAM-dependent methyltransferase